MDYFILITTLGLVAFGLLMVFSATYYSASLTDENGDSLKYFTNQLKGAGIGIGVMIGASFFPYRYLRKIKWVLVVIAGILLLAVFLPELGQGGINGSTRWIFVGGISVQPSEVAKLALIIFIAAICYQNRNHIRQFRYGILGPCIIPAIYCVIICFMPNFSAVVCIAILTLVMLIVAGSNGKQLGLVAAVVAVCGYFFMMTQSYRAVRVQTFLNPFDYYDTNGYQVVQSLYAMGSGGFWGRGLGNSRAKLMYLPYGESDFIFSVIVEEFGFFGALLLVAAFAFLIYRIIKVAMASEMFGMLIATGVATVIASQFIINIAVVTSSIPATGVSMPFISYGSSALIIFLFMIGIVLNISRYTELQNTKVNEVESASAG